MVLHRPFAFKFQDSVDEKSPPYSQVTCTCKSIDRIAKFAYGCESTTTNTLNEVLDGFRMPVPPPCIFTVASTDIV